MLCWSIIISAWLLVVVVVVACCCCMPYRLALMPACCVLTFAPYILTFGPCACGVSLLSTGANIPLAQVVVVTSCNLRRWCVFHSATSADSPLAHMVVSSSASCSGGGFSSCHWHKYCTCTQATCTVRCYIKI